MAHELGDIVIGRPFDDVETGAGLHDPTALEDRHLVTELDLTRFRKRPLLLGADKRSPGTEVGRVGMLDRIEHRL